MNNWTPQDDIIATLTTLGFIACLAIGFLGGRLFEQGEKQQDRARLKSELLKEMEAGK